MGQYRAIVRKQIWMMTEQRDAIAVRLQAVQLTELT